MIRCQGINGSSARLCSTSFWDGAAAKILKKAKIDVKRMATACDREIQRIPRVSGPGREMDKVYVSQSVDAALIEAEQQAQYDYQDWLMETYNCTIVQKQAGDWVTCADEMISFTGTRRRGNTTTRNAEIAFVNEYGKKGQPARPFIGTAMSRNEEAITAPAEKVIGDWIEEEFSKE